MTKPFHRSEITDGLVRYLREFPEGTVIGYDELSKIAAMKIDSSSTNLASAKRILLREDTQLWWAEKPKIGVRRLNTVEMSKLIGMFHLPGARRKLRRGGTIGDHVANRGWNELDAAEQRRFSTDYLQIELALNSLSRRMGRRIEVARGSSNALPSFNAIEWAIRLSPRGTRKKEI